MKYTCTTDQPPGFHPTKNKFTNPRVKGFNKRNHLSVRARTNCKAKSKFQRRHKLDNYFHYTVFKMGLDPISSASESGSDSESEGDVSEGDVIQDFGSDISESEV